MNLAPGLEGLFQTGAGLAYLLASVGYGAHLTLRKAGLARLACYATGIAVVLHTLAIGVHCAVTHRTPFTTPAEMLSASAWAVALVFLCLDLSPWPAPRALGAVALPAAFLCLFAGAVIHSRAAAATTPEIARVLESRLISLHVIAILFAFGLLVLAFACAALYLIQDFLLKRKRLGTGLFGKLPPLASIENLAFVLVAFAFPLLTVSLAAGIIQAVGGLHGPWVADHKVLASIALWLVYGGYLALHVIAHWRGTRANYVLIGGLLLALVTYFVPSTMHKFG